MHFVITAGSELPIYRQLMRQVIDAIAGGRLKPGDKLTSQRELAEQLVIAPLTVKKAYDELEREGLIRTERGRGTFVETDPFPLGTDPGRDRLKDSAQQLLTRSHLSGVAFEDLVDLLREINANMVDDRITTDDPTDD